jgi:hypothetical protein
MSAHRDHDLCFQSGGFFQALFSALYEEMQAKGTKCLSSWTKDQLVGRAFVMNYSFSALPQCTASAPSHTCI